MSELFWLTEEQKERLRPYFLNSHGKPRVDDRRVLGSIVFVIWKGLRWRDAPREYAHKTLYSRWKRWGGRSVFVRMIEGLAACLHTLRPLPYRLPIRRRPRSHRDLLAMINET